jgi:hypothetical protein
MFSAFAGAVAAKAAASNAKVDMNRALAGGNVMDDFLSVKGCGGSHAGAGTSAAILTNWLEWCQAVLVGSVLT